MNSYNMRYNPYGDLSDFCSSDVTAELVNYGAMANSLDLYRGYSSAAQINSFGRNAYNSSSGGHVVVDQTPPESYVMRPMSCDVNEMTRSFGGHAVSSDRHQSLYGATLSAPSLSPLPAISYCVPRTHSSPTSADISSVMDSFHVSDYLGVRTQQQLSHHLSSGQGHANQPAVVSSSYSQQQQQHQASSSRQETEVQKTQHQQQQQKEKKNERKASPSSSTSSTPVASLAVPEANQIKKEQPSDNGGEKDRKYFDNKDNEDEDLDDLDDDDEAEDMRTSSRLKSKDDKDDDDDDREDEDKQKANGIVFYPWMKRVHGGQGWYSKKQCRGCMQ